MLLDLDPAAFTVRAGGSWEGSLSGVELSFPGDGRCAKQREGGRFERHKKFRLSGRDKLHVLSQLFMFIQSSSFRRPVVAHLISGALAYHDAQAILNLTQTAYHNTIRAHSILQL